MYGDIESLLAKRRLQEILIAGWLTIIWALFFLQKGQVDGRHFPQYHEGPFTNGAGGR